MHPALMQKVSIPADLHVLSLVKPSLHETVVRLCAVIMKARAFSLYNTFAWNCHFKGCGLRHFQRYFCSCLDDFLQGQRQPRKVGLHLQHSR